MDPVCVYCRAATKPHCRDDHPTCSWRKCTDPACKTVIDYDLCHAVRDGEPVAWPHTTPDDPT